MDHAKHIRLEEQELTEHILTGATIYGPDDERIGHVSHVHGTGKDAVVVVDVGGFLGIGSKPVSVPAADLDFMRDDSNSVHAVSRWSKDALKEMPEHRE